jgi:hypothetical protein
VKAATQTGAKLPLIGASRRGVGILLLGLGGARQIRFAFTHRASFEIDLVSFVYQPVEDGVGQRGIADEVVPFFDGSSFSRGA